MKNVAYSALLGGLSSGVFELSPSITTNFNNNKLNPDEVISGMWEDAPNSSKNNKIENVEKSQLESVEKDTENGIIKAGGKITDFNYLDVGKYELQAEKYYAECMKDFSDVTQISKNTGFSIENISKIKNHMMIDEIRFKDGSVRKFDPDIDQALAWKRLIDGNIKKTDILLLNHELEELRIISEKNLNYEDAHQLANKKYNWEKAIQNIFDEDELYKGDFK